jgi:phage terminase large subunit GpA-like protein
MSKRTKQEISEVAAFADWPWRTGLRWEDELTPAEWIEKYFRHGANSESFDLDRFPWLRDFLDASADYRTEEQLLILVPQVGKSLGAEGLICRAIVEDPGDLTAYTHTIPLAKTWSEQRVMPSIKKCPACAPFLPLDPKKSRTCEMLMSHMVVEVAPANKSQTQQKTRRIVICDERWLWETGIYDNAKRRTSSPNFDGRRKILSFSNSGIWESDMELQWRESDQNVLFGDCPSCKKSAPFKWSEKKCRRVPESIPGFTVEWDENETTRPHGVWAIDEVVKTVRLQCPHCRIKLLDTPEIRVALRKTMKYVALNPRAGIKSRAWTASGVACYPWEDLVKQFLNASM